ncbi:MAG TPA: hypothetical protein VL307_12665 [Chitinophagaceae bacterium]|nr:hypothetical protein [Chitinophagaceae bacterium]
MNKWIFCIGLLALCSGCGNKNVPDVSAIKVDVSIGRFDKDFFAADTNKVEQSLTAVQNKYPYFFTDFIQNIVLEGSADTLHPVPFIVKNYISNARPLFDSVQIRFKDMSDVQEQLKKGFQFVKYYYPTYKIPKVVTYTGLIGDPSVALTPEAMAIGLQMYLGKNFSAYNTLEAIDKFPQYISRRFDAAYIPVNCFQNIAQDIYPENMQGLSLIEQMIEKGKQWWLVSKFMPMAPDSLITGFTQLQLNWCKTNEGLAWNFIIQNNDPFTTEPTIIQNFVGEAPKTDGMPDASPGNIGQWIGWQIVQRYAEKTGVSLPQVLQTPAKKIFEDAKYKPR